LALPMLAQPPERGDAAANRARILAAARELLATHGPGGVSMEAVAHAAGVGKGTLFRRFGSRAGLMEALVSDYMRDFQDAFLTGPPPLGPTGDPRERLEAFILELLRLQREHLPFALAADAASSHARDRVYGVLLLHTRALIHAIDQELDADIIAAMLLGAVSPSVIDRLPLAQNSDFDAVVAAARSLLGGLTASGPSAAFAARPSRITVPGTGLTH
jgi:AcrR family transcriptional regulator